MFTNSFGNFPNSRASPSPKIILFPFSKFKRLPIFKKSGIIESSDIPSVPLISAPVVTFSEFNIVSFEKNVDVELMRESDAIFSIVSFELMKPPFFSRTIWGITPRILFLSSFSKPFITETTVINTAIPMLTPRVVSIEREDNLFDPFFRRYLNEILLRNVIKKFFSLNLRKL